jgi:hypothetical protein
VHVVHPLLRDAITKRFDEYVKALEPLYEEYGAVPHWAKVRVWLPLFEV